jgi:short-subunit dehydrogenase
MTDERSQTALITGATSGIGAAFASRFAADGYDLIITGRRRKNIDALADELAETYAVKVEVVIAELSEPDQVKMLVQKVYGRQNLAILVNNAGFGAGECFVERDVNAHGQMARVHVLATIELVHAALRKMIPAGKGSIINVSSLGAFTPIPGNATYCGTKSFLIRFSESIHLELAGTGVKIQVLCPGFTRTDFHAKMGIDESRLKDRGIIRWMSPEEVVETSLRCLDKNKIVCIPGFWNKTIASIARLAPRSLYYRFASGFAGGSEA